MQLIYALVLGTVFVLAGCNDKPATLQGPAGDGESLHATQQAFDPQQAFTARCAHCHDGSVAKAPHQIEFQMIGPEAIHATLTSGLMAVHTQGMQAQDVRALATFLGGAVEVTEPVLRCAETQIAAMPPATQGWSLTLQGTRFIDGAVAGLTAEQVPQLQLKWVFEYPGATRARSQPVPYGDALLVASQDGTVYALSLADGCAYWTFAANVEVRSALAVSENGERAYFGDLRGMVYAIDPRTGREIWRTQAHEHADTTITGSPRLYQDTLYVPLSSSEWGSAADPAYPCCTFRGGVVALDVADGSIRWTSYAIPEAPAATGRTNESGAPLYHPAGAPIWNSPTIDARRGLLYVGTGEAYTSPAADTSDSVLAIDLVSGELMWHYQSISGDAWNMACFIGGGANCPVENGPDLDIGAPPMLVTVEGRDVVIAGQKSGDVFALDPADGRLLWRRKIGRGGFAGGIHWGMAASPDAIYAPNADTVFTGRFTGPRKPGLFALNAADGEVLWYSPAPDVCAEADKPACDPGLSAAVTAIPGVVFAGAFDGHLRAYAADSGTVIWDFNTHAEFTSVSGAIARGGSIEADGPVIYNGHVLINSGYLFGDRMAGNALLVFQAPD